MNRTTRLILALVTLASLYAAVACAVFAFRHPELTDTQRLLRFTDALLWR